ncbi:TMEM165/GDT1 family protein [bacterium]|nr:TMEM165/GDT1 family protein [bacterium]
MNWKIFTAAFVTLLLAELGDKTQLAVITMSAQSKAWVSVFLGGSLALVCVTLIGAVGGELITKVVPVHVLHYIAGGLFIVMGVLTILGKL